MSITMPDNVVCTFDQMCLGMECCMHIKLAIFRSSIRVFARLDPKEMKFVYGINGYAWTIKLASGSNFDGEIKQLLTTPPMILNTIFNAEGSFKNQAYK